MTTKISLISFNHDANTFKFIVENSELNKFIIFIKTISKKYLYDYNCQTEIIATDKTSISIKLTKTCHSELILDQYDNLIKEILYTNDFCIEHGE